MSSAESDSDCEYDSCDDDSSSSESSSEGVSDSELSEDGPTDAREWCPVSVNSPPVVPPRFPFTSSSSMNFTSKDGADILDYIKLFLTNEFLKIIVDETNKQGERCGDSNWTATDTDEMLVFIALNTLMALVKKPVMSQYWSTRKIIETPFFFFQIYEKEEIFVVEKKSSFL